MKRRAVFGLIGLTAKGESRIDGRIVDDSHLAGHRLRDKAAFAAPRHSIRVPVVIIGGGIAGLSAAWELRRKGFFDFVLLEMERQAGGNSCWGENEVSAYPWAAHYLPVPNRGSGLVRDLCEEAGLLHQGEWNERHLCHSPQERLFLHGRWQEGLEPEVGATRQDREEFRRFGLRMREFAATGGFTIPVGPAPGSGVLDRLSMAEWLRQNGFSSPYLHWYVDYACRDDYGALARDTSAWAGIHYFASREHDERGPFTWPEGNGWLVKHLLGRVGNHVRTGAFVHRIESSGQRWKVSAGHTQYDAAAVIFAAPSFLTRYLMEQPPDATAIVYSPWVTANLTLHRIPAERQHGEPAWDNVIYGSPSLGYVVATHQSLRSRISQTVWTYYRALAEMAPAAGRRLLLEKDWAFWKEAILMDLERAHADIRQCVSRIDVMRFGHAMARPVPGWMLDPGRARLLSSGRTLVLANSDLSGLSIFEEAQSNGVNAARRILKILGAGR
ncbi:MAG: FAD-dependent oxidoreductase [Bryobacteraceae bacterium]|nr:FAD-dependent oxidoreductase [Bryobacteraceae bacterium]